jgi:hypothetical protein
MSTEQIFGILCVLAVIAFVVISHIITKDEPWDM